MPDPARDERTVDGLFSAFSCAIEDEASKSQFEQVVNRQGLLELYRNGETSVTTDYPIAVADRTRWHRVSVTMVLNPSTGDVEAILTIRDITDNRLEELVASCVADQGYDFIGLIDAERSTFRIIRNAVWSRDDYLPRTEMNYVDCIRRFASRHVASSERSAFVRGFGLAHILKALESKTSLGVTYRYEEQGFSSEGLRKQVLLSWLDRRHNEILVTQTDVTASYKQEQEHIKRLEMAQSAFRSVNALLQSILDTTPTAIFWKDVDRRFEGANKAFLDFYGFDGLGAILGKNDEEMGWHPDADPYKNDELRVIRDGERTHRVPGVCIAHGKPCNIVASKTPRFERGKIVGLVGSFEDVTEEYKRNEEIARLNVDLKAALDAAEKANASEQAFLSNVSHDMRTPLGGILGFADLALATDDPQKREDYLNKINVSGKLMLDLVNDVLDMSKIESGKMELLPQSFASQGLFEGIVDSVRLSAEKRGIKFAAKLDDDYPRYIMADRLRLQQVVLNLLSNAIKYTPDGGSVEFEIRRIDENGFNTLVRVRDTGIGMSREFQARMFEPFAQEHQSRMYSVPGTGLGLSIVRQVVDLMSGSINVESALGKGSTFTVLLPVEAVDVEGIVPARKMARNSDLKGKRLLMCEDNDLNAEIAETILRERAGAEVERCENGKLGVEAFERSEPGFYKAILMDLRMPTMDGIEATKAIRALDRVDAKTIPIIAMSADAFAEDIRRCNEAGMNNHVSKPIDPTRLIAILDEVCQGSD